MLWDVLIDQLFPNRVRISMDEDEIERIVEKLQAQMLLSAENSSLNAANSYFENLQMCKQANERVKNMNIPEIGMPCEAELFSSRSTACGITTPYQTSLTQNCILATTNSSISPQFMVSNYILFSDAQEELQHEEIQYQTIITEEDLIQQQLLNITHCQTPQDIYPFTNSLQYNKIQSLNNEQGLLSAQQIPLKKEDEEILMEYLFQFSQEKVEDKDYLSCIDMAEKAINSRQSMLHKEGIIKLLIQQQGTIQAQTNFLKKYFQISVQVIERIGENENIKIILYQLRLVQAILLIYGHSINNDLIKLISLFCLVDDKSIKSILNQFGVKGYTNSKNNLNYKQITNLIDKCSIKSVQFATMTKLIHHIKTHCQNSNRLSSFLSSPKILHPLTACQRAELAFDNLTIHLDSSYDD